MGPKTVAILENTAIIALDLQSICLDSGLRVVGMAATASDALTKFSDTGADILITNMELAGASDGVEVAERLRMLWPEMIVIFITATTIPDKLQRIAASNPARVLKKPFDMNELRNFLCAIPA